MTATAPASLESVLTAGAARLCYPHANYCPCGDAWDIWHATAVGIDDIQTLASAVDALREIGITPDRVLTNEQARLALLAAAAVARGEPIALTLEGLPVPQLAEGQGPTDEVSDWEDERDEYEAEIARRDEFLNEMWDECHAQQEGAE